MPNFTPIIDIHVHPSIKPYGNSFCPKNNFKDLSSPSCIWHKDTSTDVDKLLENAVGVGRYRQSDFSTLTEGHYSIICLSQYPIEKDFFKIKGQKSEILGRILGQFASLLSRQRVDFVLSANYNYFEDLNKEYEFLKLLNGSSPEGSTKTYRLMASRADLISTSNLYVILTIEGAHVFCDGTDTRNPNNWKNLTQNVAKVKNWDTPPFFITLAHHFYNGLCTHAQSLYDASAKLLNQEYGMRNEGFKPEDTELPISALGEQLIDLLLQTNNGRRIHIDVKHMSIEARTAYYHLLETKYKDQKIPVIWSHGAVDFDKQEINMNLDLDVKKIYQTNGLIGIEIDQRILGYNNNRFVKWFKSVFSSKRRREFNDAEYVWKQIITIAEYAYDIGYTQNPWSCLSMGTDYDGIINALNSYRDASTVPTLAENLVQHLDKYWDNNPKIKQPSGTNAQKIINDIMYYNAFDFINKHFKPTVDLIV